MLLIADRISSDQDEVIIMSQAMAEPSAAPAAGGEQAHAAHAIERIRDALRGLRFGTVTVVIQDGFIVQVERTEKLRLVRRRE